VDQLAGKGSELSLSEVKGEVLRHMAELQAMEEHIPISITLGLVQVNCGKVGVARETLELIHNLHMDSCTLLSKTY
jgi:hypothetical protein